MVNKMLADQNFKDFHGRVTRIEKARSKGYGFEARGTLGRSTTWKRDRSAWRLLKSLLVVFAVCLVLKGAIHHYVGAELYGERVAALLASEGFDRVGGILMHADMVTLTISGLMAEVFPK